MRGGAMSLRGDRCPLLSSEPTARKEGRSWRSRDAQSAMRAPEASDGGGSGGRARGTGAVLRVIGGPGRVRVELRAGRVREERRQGSTLAGGRRGACSPSVRSETVRRPISGPEGSGRPQCHLYDNQTLRCWLLGGSPHWGDLLKRLRCVTCRQRAASGRHHDRAGCRGPSGASRPTSSPPPTPRARSRRRDPPQGPRRSLRRTPPWSGRS